MSTESVILILFIVASVVSIAARRLNLSYTIALMAVGLGLGSLHLLHPPHLSRELLYTIFLPPLIFEAAIHLRSDDLQRDWPTIATLVVPGVILSTLATAGVMIPVSQHFSALNLLSWPVGILFGAAVAATDPVAVVALFRRLGAPRRLRILVESESLLNDGTSIVVFTLAWAYIQGKVGGIEGSLLEFLRVVGFGLLTGVVVGLLTGAVMERLDDAMVVITLSTVAAYGSFLIADRLGVSGVMSTVAAGLVTGERGLSRLLFPSIRLATESFWEYIAFVMNSMIFLLMGFAIDLEMLWKLWPFVLLAYLSVTVARAVVVAGTWAIFYPTYFRFPAKWVAVLTWGGLRGALSMVLAMSLPDSFIYKPMIETLVFGVVLISIFVQGLSMAPVLRFLGIIEPVSKILEYEMFKTRASLIQSALDEIRTFRTRHMISRRSAKAIEKEFQKELSEINQKLEALEPDRQEQLREELYRMKRRILLDQKKSLLEIYQSGEIGFEAYRELRREIDGKLFELENQGTV